MSSKTITRSFRWVPVEESGILVRCLPGFEERGDVEANWWESHPAPVTAAGDVTTLIASQRPITTIAVTSA